MQTFIIDSLVSLVQQGIISPKIASANAANPDELKMALKGIINS